MSELNDKLDPSIVAGLYVQHAEELRRFLLGILRDAQLTSDVLQARFVKLAERGQETREATRKAWLFRVAYHEAMAIRRREGVDARRVVPAPLRRTGRFAWAEAGFARRSPSRGGLGTLPGSPC